VEHAVQPAHGRDLQRRRRRPGAVPRVRRAAGPGRHAHRSVASQRERLARRPGAELAPRSRLRDRAGDAAPHQPRHGVRRVQGAVQPPVAAHGAGAAALDRRAVAVRDAQRRAALPLSARRTDGHEPARPAGGLLRVAVRPQVDRRRRDVDGHLARPHGQRPALPQRGERRADHDRHDGRGALCHALQHRREPRGAGGDLGGGERRARARHARRGPDVGERHAARPAAGRARADGGAVAAPCGRRVRGRAPLPARRLPSVRLQDRRLRPHLAPAHAGRQRHPGRPPGARRPRGPGARGAPVRGHRVRRIRERGRRCALAAVRPRPAGGAGDRSRRAPPRRPRGEHPGTRLLDSRRARPAPRAGHPGGARGWARARSAPRHTSSRRARRSVCAIARASVARSRRAPRRPTPSTCRPAR